ncbi:MAG: TIGR02147 family protein [Chitinispirillaceae bacterium]|nr:TIGR02147 family protein [Chitinispirillaceae bacterium]
MKNITEYSDYRLLLQDFYKESKRKNSRFSYQMFSRISGISSKGLLYNVVTGKRRLSSSHIEGLAEAMKLNRSQAVYFENLVGYNNARTLKEKKRYFERMAAMAVKEEGSSHVKVIREDQYRFYSEWYHSVVRSLIGLHGFSGDHEKLAQMIYPPVTPGQVKKSVALLVKLGLVEKTDRGTYRLTDATITTPPDIAGVAVYNYHTQMAAFACRALEEIPKEMRDFSAVTLGISKKTIQRLRKEVETFRNRLLDIAESDSDADEDQGVMQLNFQLFSVSRFQKK